MNRYTILEGGSQRRLSDKEMHRDYHLKSLNDSILVDGKKLSEDEFGGLLRRAHHHTIAFQNGSSLRSAVEKGKSDWVIRSGPAVSCSFQYYYQKVLELLKKSDGILSQDECYLD